MGAKKIDANTSDVIETSNEMTGFRGIEVITAEIQFYKAQAGSAILEIGNRLLEAKEQLQHGEWLAWLNDKVEFSERAAQNFMRLAKEFSNPHTLADLGTSKALVLLSLPTDERDTFTAETHNIDGEEKTVGEMSTRELETAVRERNEALEAKATVERMLKVQQKAIQSAEKKAAEAEEKAEQMSRMMSALEVKLEEAENSEPEIKEDSEPQIMLEEVRNNIISETKREIEEKLKKKIDKANKEKLAAEAAEKEIKEELERRKQEFESEQKMLNEQVEKLQKQLAISGSGDIVTFKYYFEAAQMAINNMISGISKLQNSDPVTADKLTAALCGLCEQTIKHANNAE